jgi:hypothetical protein
MDGIKIEPDSDSDIEPVSALCETELMDVKEDYASASGSSSITAEVHLCNHLYSNRNMEVAYYIIILLAFTTHLRVFSLLSLEVSRSHTRTHHSR